MGKSPWMKLLLMAVIAGCVGWLTYYYKSQPEPGEPLAIPLPIACAACGKYYVAPLGKQPTACHYCKKVDAWRAMKCQNPKCKGIVPLINDPKGPNQRPIGKCVKCGESRLSEEVSPDEIKPP